MLWLHNHVKPPTLPLSPTINLFQPIFFLSFCLLFPFEHFLLLFFFFGWLWWSERQSFSFLTQLWCLCVCVLYLRKILRSIYIYTYLHHSYPCYYFFFFFLMMMMIPSLFITVSPYLITLSSHPHLMSVSLSFSDLDSFSFFSFFGTHLISKASVMFFCLRDGAHTRIHTHTPRLLRLAIGSWSRLFSISFSPDLNCFFPLLLTLLLLLVGWLIIEL